MDRRNFIKNTSLALGSLMLMGAASAQKYDKPALEKIIHRNYRECDNVAKANNQYLIDNVDCDRTEKILSQEKTKYKLASEIDRLEHIDYEFERNITFGLVDVRYQKNLDLNFLNPRQLARVHLLMDTLKKDVFRREIEGEILADRRDIQKDMGYLPSERGGLVKYDGGIVSLFPMTSLDSKKKYSKELAEKSNRSFLFDLKEVDRNRHIIRYHLHAVREDNWKFSGPSFNVNMGNGIFGGDINLSKLTTNTKGESHDIIISKLKGDKFNICYYSGEIVKEGKIEINLISLGNWKY